MALVGKRETRPTSTTSRGSYEVLMIRCLLCGGKSEFVIPRSYAITTTDSVVPTCHCYDDDPRALMQDVRIIPND